MNFGRWMIASAMTFALAGPAWAHEGHDHEPHAGDFEVHVEDGHLHVHPAVLGSDLDPDFGYATDEPGYDGEPGSFSPGSAIGFNIVGPLSVWNGGGFDALSPALSETMRVSFLSFSRMSSDGFVSGFSIPVGDEGDWHRHLAYTLQGAPDGQGGFGVPSDGVYLLALELFSTDSSLGSSNPIYLVLNNGADEEDHEAAIEWVEANVVPAPGTLAVLACAAVAGLVRRRRD